MLNRTAQISISSIVAAIVVLASFLLLVVPAVTASANTNNDASSFHFLDPHYQDQSCCSSGHEMGSCCSTEGEKECPATTACKSGTCCLTTDMLLSSATINSDQLAQEIVAGAEHYKTGRISSFIFRPPKPQL